MGKEAAVLAAAKKTAHALGCLWLRLSFLPGVSVGWPDLLILIPGGFVLFMECKAAGKKPTPMQQHRMTALERLGFATVVCDSPGAASHAIVEACKSR